MQEERETKRARQACENCRRKKTRCSGERPVCQFCARLRQTCVYNGRIITGTVQSVPSNLSGNNSQASATSVHNQADLAARLAFIESRLGLSGDDTLRENATTSDEMRPSPRDLGKLVGAQKTSDRSASIHEVITETGMFSTVPPLPILKAMADVYFNSCHNQPYCFFLESSFRQRLIDGTLPDFLLMAFVATAARYSNHAYFQNRQSEATETYARTAWHIVLKLVFSSEQGLNLHAVQATTLLAVIDFTAGQHRLGWVKIGLAIRFAQGLRLNAEPDPSLPVWEQEEHRRVFWSVYILDRFVSCCRLRPPSILDFDCTVALPFNEQQFPIGTPAKPLTLAVLKDLPDISGCKSLNHFALLVLVASALGRIVRYNLQQSTSKNYPPWDFRSDSAKISTILLSFETLLSVGDQDLATSIQDKPAVYGGFDSPWIGHFIWSRGLYHLSCCLLHHPLFLYRNIQHHRDSFPRTFARASLRHCQEHAEHLTKILQLILEKSCCARGSFLGYFAVVAGSVHRLYEHSADLSERAQALQRLQVCVDFLEKGPVYWGNYPRMATALRDFQINQSRALALIEPHFLENDLDSSKLDTLACILDYGWLSDANRSDRPARPKTPQNTDLGNWGFFDDLIGSDAEQPLDIVGQGMNSLFQKNGPVRDWWFNTGNENIAASGQMFDFLA